MYVLFSPLRKWLTLAFHKRTSKAQYRQLLLKEFLQITSNLPFKQPFLQLTPRDYLIIKRYLSASTSDIVNKDLTILSYIIALQQLHEKLNNETKYLLTNYVVASPQQKQ
jgi:hypothetical protein